VATVTALQSFIGRVKKDKTAPVRKVEADGVTYHFPGAVLEEGESVQVIKGQNYDSNHPVVKQFPDMFGAIDSIHPVEQATAAPGEKRGAH
jgi:hypothetical protein